MRQNANTGSTTKVMQEILGSPALLDISNSQLLHWQSHNLNETDTFLTFDSNVL